MTFLAYRFLPAAVLVALVFWRPLRRLPAAGWRAGLVMGIFLTAGYVAQTFGLEHTTASNAGFITGLFVVLTPLFGALAFGLEIGRAAWAAAFLSAVGPAAAVRRRRRSQPERRRRRVPLRVRFRDPHPAHGARRDPLRRRRAGRGAARRLRPLLPRLRGASPASSRPPRGATVWSALLVTSLVASALGFLVQSYAQRHASPARTALILAAEPAFAGLFGYLLQDERLSALAWTGAVLIMAAIVLVDVVPRLRPPRPLPEG